MVLTSQLLTVQILTNDVQVLIFCLFYFVTTVNANKILQTNPNYILSQKRSPPQDFIKRTLTKAMETPTFVTDGDDYYCPRFRMRNRRCLLAPLTTVILTLEKRKLHMYFFLSVNKVVKIQDTYHPFKRTRSSWPQDRAILADFWVVGFFQRE